MTTAALPWRTKGAAREERRPIDIWHSEPEDLRSCVVRGFGLKPSLLWRKPLAKVSTVLRQLAAK